MENVNLLKIIRKTSMVKIGQALEKNKQKNTGP